MRASAMTGSIPAASVAQGGPHREWSLRVVGDDTTRTASIYDAHGYLVETRPYNEAENAAADARAAEAARVDNGASVSTKLSTVDFPNMQAILAQTNAALREDPSQEIKDLARAVRRLVRKVENMLDGTE